MNANKVKPVFTAALFSVTKLWNQPKCQLMGKWAQKMCNYLHFYLYLTFSVLLSLNKEENSGFVSTRVNLGNVLLNKITRHRKTNTTLCYLPMEFILKSKPQKSSMMEVVIG